ncbi:MAG: peptide chain release factor N(5)-glutamine methyltransferase [Beijerinckiaceae bacterium]
MPPEARAEFSAALSRAAAQGLAAALFKRAGLDNPARDARVLLCDAAGIDRAALIREPDAQLGEAAAGRLRAFVGRRLAHEPVSRIIGRREFWGLTLSVTPDVLDPRADTETLVAAAIEMIGQRRDEALRILDLGAGSGALLCALLSEFGRAFGIGIDRDEAVCRVAQENLELCGLGARGAIVCGDWGAALVGGFDLIVSNPPYIASAHIAGLAPEVRNYDPALALDGGEDGFAAYRAIAADLPRLCAPGAAIVVEIGYDGAAKAAGCFRQAGWPEVSLRCDLENRPRALLMRR